jgi:hypothetical protein
MPHRNPICLPTFIADAAGDKRLDALPNWQKG